MMPWNRREVWMGLSLEVFAKVKNKLSEGQIEYDYNVKSPWSGGRGGRHEGSFGIAAGSGGNPQTTGGPYYVYVHKYDFEKAQRVLSDMKTNQF